MSATSFVPACTTSEVAEGAAVGVVLDGCPVAVVRSQGHLYAIRDVCSHANVALSEGEVEDGSIECWLHGSMFDLATGRPTNLPATEPVPVYPVRVEDDMVLVGLSSQAVSHPTGDDTGRAVSPTHGDGPGSGSGTSPAANDSASRPSNPEISPAISPAISQEF